MKIFISTLLMLLMTSSFAALPPEYQNEKDLNVMVKYINQNPKVISTLHSIDFRTKTVYFGDNCWAKFVRKEQHKPRGWVGPAAPMVFSKSNCKIDE
jgi:hypothetical protein